jgi:hypothetical protein
MRGTIAPRGETAGQLRFATPRTDRYDPPMPGLGANVPKIYAFKFLSDFLVMVPVIVPFYKSCGLTVTEFMIVQSVYSVSALLLEIPSGYLADALGRKRALVLGAAFFPTGLAVYALSSSFWPFCLGELLLAVSVSLRSGADSALVYDTLLEFGREAEYKRIEGRARLFERLGTGVSSVAGGLLALASLRLPLYVNAVTATLLLAVAIRFEEPRRTERRSRSPARDMIGIARRALADRRILLLALFQSLFLCSGIVGIWLAFLYYGALRLSLVWYGISFFAFQVLAGLSSEKACVAERLVGRRRLFPLLLLLGPSFVLLGAFESPWLIPLVWLNAVFWGLSTPLVLDALNKLVESEIRATVLSVTNMVGRLCAVICFPIFGQIVDRASLSTAFVALGIAVVVLGAPLVWALNHQDTEG